jgi:hypothetical protein
MVEYRPVRDEIGCTTKFPICPDGQLNVFDDPYR